MSQTILMERVLDQTRLAVIEDGRLCEMYIRRPGDENLSGNVYLGRVERVLPGVNAAFVDIGLEKKGFLSAGDIRLFAQDGALAARLSRSRIETLVRPGQTLPVQVVRAEPGAKGPRLSCHITLAGRLTARMTGIVYVGVSRKIDAAAERDRLRAVGESLVASGDGGVILRTAAQGAAADDIRADYARLGALWSNIEARARTARAPTLLLDDGDPALRVARDMLSDDVEAVWTDGAECHRTVLEHVRALAPEHEGRVRLHDSDVPLFDLYRVDSQVDAALHKRVWLKGGGSLVIEQTEAMTVIDVNTAKNTGGRACEETLFENNREAALEAMRQLRLRDIGGIVIVDFIDMSSEAHRQALLALLRECAARDRNRVRVVDMTPLGLVELTRKRVRQSLSGQLTRPCAACGGDGVEPANEAVARRAARELWRRRRVDGESPLVIEAAPAVCALLRKLGAPSAFGATVRPDETVRAGEYRLSVGN